MKRVPTKTDVQMDEYKDKPNSPLEKQEKPEKKENTIQYDQ